ncbi:MAG: hypothetical protein AAF829_11005 [Pseudomonadota bacterium]
MRLAMDNNDKDVAHGRRWAGAAIASLVVYVMGQAFAYSPIKVYSDEEIMSVIMPGLAPASGGAVPTNR